MCLHSRNCFHRDEYSGYLQLVASPQEEKYRLRSRSPQGPDELSILQKAISTKIRQRRRLYARIIIPCKRILSLMKLSSNFILENATFVKPSASTTRAISSRSISMHSGIIASWYNVFVSVYQSELVFFFILDLPKIQNTIDVV